MTEWISRTQLLLKEESIRKLENSSVCIFGIGGVGSFAAEAIARCAVGHIILVDGDDIALSNINRQIHSTTKTVGQPKVEIMANRIKEINPSAKIDTFKIFYKNSAIKDVFFQHTDYIIDAIDDIEAKTNLINEAYKNSIPIISAMGAANKLDPTKFKVADIYSTSIDPVARIMRKNLRALGIEQLKVVYSKEPPIISDGLGSVSFTPSVMGLILAGEVIKDLIFGKI